VTRRREIIEAVRDKLRRIRSDDPRFETDLGEHVQLGEVHNLGPDDPPQVAIMVGEDEIVSQRANFLIRLPIAIGVVVHADYWEPYMAAEDALGDVRRALEDDPADRTLGGLVSGDFFERGTTQVTERESGSDPVGLLIEYVFPYQEGWGEP